MASEKHTVRYGAELLTDIDAYCAKHDLGRSQFARLAALLLLRRNPPRKLPEGVKRTSATPDPATAGKAGAEARWSKREREATE